MLYIRPRGYLHGARAKKKPSRETNTRLHTSLMLRLTASIRAHDVQEKKSCVAFPITLMAGYPITFSHLASTNMNYKVSVRVSV